MSAGMGGVSGDGVATMVTPDMPITTAAVGPR
jgi:hypothetical protein